MDKNDKIFKYNIVYFILIIGSIIFMFLPWMVEYGYVYPGVEILHLIPLFIITICFLVTSSILNFVYYYYDTNRVVYIVGFGLGIAGTVLGTISGIFGIYYFYAGLRGEGFLLLGSGIYWVLVALILLTCVLLFVNNRRGKSQEVPITDL
ncbi:MAG: hypothetical protein HWN67_12925 [Candidatus Helarchaeota archaeon]|nr:hypothetical protein [Candidatus Helarchaeota archaeon]